MIHERAQTSQGPAQASIGDSIGALQFAFASATCLSPPVADIPDCLWSLSTRSNFKSTEPMRLSSAALPTGVGGGGEVRSTGYKLSGGGGLMEQCNHYL
jgi:hypothetical protein